MDFPITDLMDEGTCYATLVKTGDYVWKPGAGARKRPLRQLRLPISADEPSP